MWYEEIMRGYDNYMRQTRSVIGGYHTGAYHPGATLAGAQHRALKGDLMDSGFCTDFGVPIDVPVEDWEAVHGKA